MRGVRPVRRYPAAAVVAAYLAFAPGAAAQPATATSLTPGRVALLANKLDADALDRLRTALADSDPFVRTVAARVSGIARIADLATAVADALGREQDETAAAEMLRALIFYDTPETRAAADRYGQRAKAPAIAVYFEWFARAPVDRVPERVDELLAVAGKADSQLAPLMARIVLQNRVAGERLLRAWLSAAPPHAWRTVLDLIGGDLADAEVPVMREALASTDADTREQTVWAIVGRLALGLPVPAATLDAALPPADAGDPTSELVGREMIARRHRKAATPDRAAFLERLSPADHANGRLLMTLGELTATERRALRDVLGPTASASPAESAREKVTVRSGRQPTMRTVTVPWARVMTDLLSVTGCKLEGRPWFAFYDVAYRADGRPSAISLENARLSEACFAAVSALGRMTLADPKFPVAAGQAQLVVVPLHKEYVECLASSTTVPPGRVSRGKIEQPRKTRDVRPVYPTAAQQDRRQGTVVIEATVSDHGCVRDAYVLGGVHPSLDYAALQAVSQWRFSPTLLDGVPVPVMMTVTVNFTLN